MKALFTKDCLDWVGHLIIQATIWKQRSKLKAKCGLLRKKLLVCVCCKYCCMRVYFKAMSCFVPVKQKQNDQSMHYILLIWHLIILNVCEGTLVWLNLGQVSFPKVPVQKKKRKEKRSECDHVIRRRWCFWLPPRAQPKEDEAVCVCTERQPQGCRGEDAGNKINNSDRHWVCSRSIIQGSGGSSIAYHYDIKGSCRLESPGRHQRQVSPRHAW